MSHITRIRTKMAEKEYLLKALDDAGYRYDEDGGEIRGWAITRAPAEIKVHLPNSKYNIGFTRNGGFYEAVADWYGIRKVSQKDFIEKISQRYAYHATKAKLEEQGFSLVEEESRADGRIHLLVRRMA
jgi:hypothetical protein